MTAVGDVERALDRYLAAIDCRCGGPVVTIGWDPNGAFVVEVAHEDPGCPGEGWTRTHLVNVPTGGRL